MKDGKYEESLPSYEAAKRAQAEVREHLKGFEQSRLRAAAPVVGLALLVALGAGGATSLLGTRGSLVALAAAVAFAAVLFATLIAHALRIRRAQKRVP
jgi:heme A synthase